MIPSEISLGEVYLPPLLIVATAAICLATITASVLNRLRWSRYVAAPTLVFLAIVAIYTVLLGTFAIPI